MTSSDPKSKSPRHSRPAKPREIVALSLALAVLFVGLLIWSWPPATARPVSYSTIAHDIATGRATHADVNNNDWSVTLTLRDGSHVTSGFPQFGAATLTNSLLTHHVTTTVDALASSPWWQTYVRTLFPLIVILGGAYVLISRQGQGVRKMTDGQSSAVEVPPTRFSDVGGADEAVGELAELVEFLSDPTRFERAGARIPRGILLVGPPGTGKTLMARAVAGEAGVPFFALSGSDFVETFVGVGASRVRQVFKKARKSGRAIIFIDEIDAVGKTRVNGAGNGATEERENTLNQLLVEMDGFNMSGVIVLAATNRPDVLDSALTRAGRFDRRIPVPLPDRVGRTRILELLVRRRNLTPDVDLATVARRTSGLSGADLDYLMNESALEAARDHRDAVSRVDLDRALETVRLGRARTSAVVTDADRTVTAWHEAGHTVAALVATRVPDPVSVSIIPRGSAGGATWMDGSDDHFISRSKALEQITVLLAGRAAEMRLLDGDVTQGSSSDLAIATRLATEMVTRYGMTDAGLAVVDLTTADPTTSANTLREVNRLLADAQDAAHDVLEQHRELLARVAQWLLDEDTLSSEDIAQLRRSDPLLAAAPAE